MGFYEWVVSQIKKKTEERDKEISDLILYSPDRIARTMVNSNTIDIIKRLEIEISQLERCKEEYLARSNM